MDKNEFPPLCVVNSLKNKVSIICYANQLTCFNMMETFALRELSNSTSPMMLGAI